jgi:hypothetical protein
MISKEIEPFITKLLGPARHFLTVRVGSSLLSADNHSEVGNLAARNLRQRAVKLSKGGSLLRWAQVGG